MIPTADFLIRTLAEAYAIGGISHIANDDGPGFAFYSYADDGPADLVLHVSNRAPVLPVHPGARAQKPSVSPATFLLSADGFGDGSQPLGVALLLVSQFAAGDDGGFFFVANNSRMDFAHVRRDGVVAGWGFWLLAIFSDDMPIVTRHRLVVYQSHLQNTQAGLQRIGKMDHDLVVTPAIGEQEHSPIALDGRRLPDCGAEFLPVVWKLAVDADFAKGEGYGAGFIEPLLGGVYSVGVETSFGIQEVVQFFSTPRTEPVPVVAIDAPVGDERLGIDAPGLQIKTVCCILSQFAWNDVRANHTSLPIRLKPPRNPPNHCR